MNPYNAAFFGLFENVFLSLKAHYDESTALHLCRELMEKGLGSAYGNTFKKGDPHEFTTLVGERDKSVGLRVAFPLISNDTIIYQFLDDPFPNLKGEVEASKLDAIYMQFKVSHLLGDNWSYKTTQHIWDNGELTEHVIEKLTP